MYSNRLSSGPAAQVGYVPYFYYAGLFSRYLVPAVDTARPAAHRAVPFAEESPFGSDFGPAQTVEQVVARGYLAVPYANPITALISDKAHVARLGLDDVITQIRSRYEIYERNMDELQEAVCEVHNGLFRQLAEHGTLVANQRQQYSITKQVQKLYEARREERTDLWRDVSRLKLALPETAQQYLGAYRKLAVLREEAGDSE